MRITANLPLRAPDCDDVVWLLRVLEDGTYELLSPTNTDSIRAAIPALESVVEHEREEGDSDGLHHLRVAFLHALREVPDVVYCEDEEDPELRIATARSNL